MTLGLLSAMAPLATDLQLPGLPDLARSMGASQALAQATISVSLAGLAVGQLCVGSLSDRIGRRRPLLACSALFSLTGVLCAIAPNMPFLLGVRLAQGCAGGGCVVVARAMVRDLAHGPRAAKIYSQIMVAFLIAPVVAPVIGGQVLRFTSWRGLFWTFAVLTLAQFALAVAAAPESLPPAARTHHSERQWRALAQLARDRRFTQHMVMSMCQGATFLTYVTMSAGFLHSSYGVGPQAYSALFAANAIAMVIGNALLGATQLMSGALVPSLVSLQFGASGHVMALTMTAAGGVGVLQVMTVLRTSPPTARGRS